MKWMVKDIESSFLTYFYIKSLFLLIIPRQANLELG